MKTITQQQNDDDNQQKDDNHQPLTLEKLREITGNKNTEDPKYREYIKKVTGKYPEEMKQTKFSTNHELILI